MIKPCKPLTIYNDNIRYGLCLSKKRSLDFNNLVLRPWIFLNLRFLELKNLKCLVENFIVVGLGQSALSFFRKLPYHFSC